MDFTVCHLPDKFVSYKTEADHARNRIIDWLFRNNLIFLNVFFNQFRILLIFNVAGKTRPL